MMIFFRIIRFPNLLIIAIAFLAMKYFVFAPVYQHFSIQVSPNNQLSYLLTILSTMLIAASGYISNDYFDIETDHINKPGKVYIGSEFPRKKTLSYALITSILAISIATILIICFTQILSGIFLYFALFVSWWYSIKLKKTFIWGNLAVAFMSAGTIPLATITETYYNELPLVASNLIWLITASVFAFAWISSLIREMVKDIEDEPGDRLTGCRSMPVVKGIDRSKKIIISLIVVMLFLLLAAQLMLIQYGRYVATGWLFFTVEIAAVLAIYKLRKANLQTEYHHISLIIKWIMVAGILSLVAAKF